MSRVPTLYITRNGLLEPLGQSQVFGYLRGLSRDHAITVISYEKDEDWADRARVAALRADCDRLGIRWLPQHFRPRPRIIAPALSMLRMVWLLRREVRGQKARLIHARSYIPAAVARVVGRITGVPFIFDMRALWPEELITAGRLKRGSVMHKAIVRAERACLRDAGAVVALTHAAAGHLRRSYPDDLAGQRLAIIPTCADLARFVPAEKPPETPVYGCLGTMLSGWFRIDWLKAFLEVAARRDPGARFELTTRDDARALREAIGGGGALQEKITIAPSAPDRVQEVLQGQKASVMFYAGGEVSELGRSPTRLAEILGCGLPVVANAGVGDVARVVQENRVGVLAEGPSPLQMEAAWEALQELMRDPELAARCRRTAEKLFSLKTGTEAYARLYEEVLGTPGPEQA
ncbi:MAG: glycosyltransferase [Rhodobacterales bacterium]|nr:MAG: glycosyltransferase [Rhodobacterales bacterium]